MLSAYVDELMGLYDSEDNSESYEFALFPDDVQEALFESGAELDFE